MPKARRLSKQRKEELLKDYGNVDNSAQLIEVAIQSYYGDHATATITKDNRSVIVTGLKAKELHYIRGLFSGIVVQAGKPKDTPEPPTLHAEGKLEELRKNVELSILESIACFNEDWVVMSWRQPRCEKAYFHITVSRDEGDGEDEGSPAYVQEWIDTVNALFRSNKVLRAHN